MLLLQVAKDVAQRFQPGAKLEAYHANIMDSQFNDKWFRSFNIVFNALDNLAARRHVNRMCLAAGVPLVESGTTGFNGQVQVIEKVSRVFAVAGEEKPRLMDLHSHRESQNATNVTRSRFPNHFLSAQSGPLRVNRSTALCGQRATYYRTNYRTNPFCYPVGSAKPSFRELFGASEETEELDNTENPENGELISHGILQSVMLKPRQPRR